jgi:hypothetical protein
VADAQPSPDAPGHGSKLSGRWTEAIAALLSSATVREAATLLGVSESSLYRLLRRPEFQARYRKAGEAVVKAAVNKVQAAAVEAVAVLVAAMRNAGDADRIRAATTILDRALQAVEVAGVVEKVNELEALLRAAQERAAERHRQG